MIDKIIVAGGRDFKDHFLLELALERRIASGDEIVNGLCPTGADLLAREYAENNRYLVKLFPANWKDFGVRAGPIRNSEMADYGNVLIAFWDGYSRGTKDMISKALSGGLEVHVYRY